MTRTRHGAEETIRFVECSRFLLARFLRLLENKSYRLARYTANERFLLFYLLLFCLLKLSWLIRRGTAAARRLHCSLCSLCLFLLLQIDPPRRRQRTTVKDKEIRTKTKAKHEKEKATRKIRWNGDICFTDKCSLLVLFKMCEHNRRDEMLLFQSK